MQKQTAGTILALLLIFVGGLRLIFALSEPTLAFEGYQHALFLSHLQEEGTPLRENPLSYSGREHLYNPIFYYLLLPFSFIIGIELTLKIIPNLIYLSTIFFVFLLARDISKNNFASIIAALFAGLGTLSFSQHINSASPYTLISPLFLLCLYALLEPKKRLLTLILTTTILGLLSPSIFLLVAGLIMYLVIIALEKMTVDREHVEALFFMSFFSLWSLLITYKDALINQGFNAFFIFLPSNVFLEEYSRAPLIIAIALIGVLPALLGMIAAYQGLFVRRNKKVFLLLGVLFATIISVLLRITPFEIGLAFMTFILAVLSAQVIKYLHNYFEKTKFSHLRIPSMTLLILFFVITSIFPAVSYAANIDTPSQEHLLLVQELERGRTVLASTKEGFFFQYHGFRTITDTDFLNVVHIEEQHEIAQELYRARFMLSALEHTDALGIHYIVLSPQVSEQFSRDELLFVNNNCFRRVFNETTIQAYEVNCHVQTR